MTFREKFELDYTNLIFTPHSWCPIGRGYEEPHPCDGNCVECWNLEMPESKVDVIRKEDILSQDDKQPAELDDILNPKPHILDSGARREFGTGAVRDIQEGKGRCDLLPLDTVGNLYAHLKNDGGNNVAWVFLHIRSFMVTNDVNNLFAALSEAHIFENTETMLLEVAKHFEEGCKKYGDNNWQKGIPTHCYIDSAVRHYLKYLRGDKDEPHDRAFCWNILCCIWTCMHKPEMDDFRKSEAEEW